MKIIIVDSLDAQLKETNRYVKEVIESGNIDKLKSERELILTPDTLGYLFTKFIQHYFEDKTELINNGRKSS